MASEDELREDARRLVESVAFEEQGNLPEEEWAMLSAHSRERFRSAMKIKDDRMASSVTTLAKSLYSSNARFVFELLQNADDNCFDKAKAKDEEPYVAFKLYRDRIIVDCNEDGFTEKNLRAICDVGNSSKNQSGKGQKYIGEKGIGFKSVFMAAWKVHINSGYLTFHFKSRPGDNGLGMICPIWDNDAEKLEKPLTRMTLLLHDGGDEQLLRAQRHTIRQQFYALQENLLLFLGKLKNISFREFDDGNNEKQFTMFTRGRAESDRVTLTKTVTKDGDIATESKESKIYYVVTHTVGNLARNDNRNYSEFEEETQSFAQADVVLAFPMHTDSTPITEAQDVFAFLPMGHAGFSFLIQADFVTEANRQGLVTTSQRNLGLLRGVGEAFVKAVQQFCNDDNLRYTWMQYLPNNDGRQYGHFWSQLITMIEERLRHTPLLRPWSGSRLRPILELYQALPCVLDCYGKPLFNDLNPRIYLSGRYSDANIQILKKYGLSAINEDQVLDLVDQDLRLEASRIKSDNTEDDWHERAAQLLYMTFTTKKYNNHQRQRLLKMPLLPLQDGTWVSPVMKDSIYFSKSCGVPIPEVSGLNLIDGKVEKISKRVDLFKQLGVHTAGVDTVREAILERHRHGNNLPKLIRGMVKHLQFLYLTHHLAARPMRNSANVLLNAEDRCPYATHEVDVYLPDDHEFGTKNLFGNEEEDSETNERPELKFIHCLYLDSIPYSSEASVGSWRDWMCSYAGVRRLVPLVTTSKPPNLSKFVYYIQRHLPGKFIGFLRHHWPEGGKKIESTPGLRKELGRMKVLCDGGVMKELSMTYLAFQDLKEKCSRFLREEEKFPFLEHPAAVDRGSYAKEWGFLVSIGVRVVDDVFFYLSILHEIRKTGAGKISDEKRIISLYNAIYGTYVQSSSTDVSRWKATVSNFFADGSAIYVPASQYGHADWAAPSQCLWNAPSCLTSRYPLEARLEKLLSANSYLASSTQSLCLNLLEIPDCTWSNIVEELKQCKKQGCKDFDKMETLYEHLNDMTLTIENVDKKQLWAEFQNDALIYLPNSNGSCWHKVSQCLWSSATRIQGKTVLDQDYENLYIFFVKFLGVDTLNLQLVYDDLIHLGYQSRASVEQVKGQIWVLNSLIGASEGNVTLDTGKLLEARVFPVKLPGSAENQVKLYNADTDFAIIDRTHLGEYFGSKVKTLDFNFDEVRDLSPLISWLRLDSRYMSQNVTEVSSVSGADEQPVPASECIIRPKTHALCRVAFHYKSLRLENSSIKELYNLLSGVKVFQTDGIHCELHLPQDNKTYPHISSRSDLHYREDQSLLQIFIPHDRKRRNFCYARKLPQFLFEWLMRDPPDPKAAGTGNEKGYRLVAAILNSSRSVISEILEEDGIATINIEDDELEDETRLESDLGNDPNPEQTTAPAEDDGQAPMMPLETVLSDDATSLNVHTPSTTTVQRPPSRSTTYEETSYVEARTRLSSEQTQPRHHTSRSSTPPLGQMSRVRLQQELPATDSRPSLHLPAVSTRPGSPVYQPPSTNLQVSREDENTYGRLLEQVVTAAREGVFPTQGSLDLSSLQDALPGEADLGYDGTVHSVRFRSKPQLERDRMIGAAGELYAFELLNALNPALPGFSIDNWESTIRHYVNLHPDYRNIERQRTTEVADIVYNDANGAFTRLLIDHGCLDDTWRHLTPKYLLEVKSTTGPCEAAFFVSRNQYQRIQEHRNSRETVYVILRVFDLGKDRVGMRVYVDPAELAASGRLVFTAGEWAVVPGS